MAEQQKGGSLTDTGSLLYKRVCHVTDRIGIVIPTVGEVIDNEDEYYGIIHTVTAMPIDYMVQLDDVGIDFSSINDYELFLMLFSGIREKDLRLVFSGFDPGRMELSHHIETGAPVLYDEENDLVIDRVVYTRIAEILRKIHHLEKNNKKPGNEEARKYMLERARKKAERRKTRPMESQLEQLITAMVNTEQFKYGYEGTRELSIYQFNESVRQIMKKVDYDNKMHGIYAGTVDPKHLSQDDLNWLIHK